MLLPSINRSCTEFDRGQQGKNCVLFGRRSHMCDAPGVEVSFSNIFRSTLVLFCNAPLDFSTDLIWDHGST